MNCRLFCLCDASPFNLLKVALWCNFLKYFMCPLKVCILQKLDTRFFIYLLHQAKYCVDCVTHFLPPDLDLSDPPDLSPDKRERIC